MQEKLHNSTELTAILEHINGQELEQRINELASIGQVGEGGSRLAFSPLEKGARAYLRDMLANAGVDELKEYAGGLVGIYRGAEPALSAVGFGSHFDTVPRAGKYDGPFGTIAALNVVEVFNSAGVMLKRSLVVIAFTA